MAVMSIRGIDEKAMARLKQQAEQEGSSLNSLVLRLLEAGSGSQPALRPAHEYADLDALAGTWDAGQVEEFAEHTAAFGEVDAALWK